jgi:hypothetical protein
MATIEAIEKRINRKLKQDGQVLRKPRSERARRDMGDYYILDYRTNVATDTDVDILGLAPLLDVLTPEEEIEAIHSYP